MCRKVICTFKCKYFLPLLVQISQTLDLNCKSIAHVNDLLQLSSHILKQVAFPHFKPGWHIKNAIFDLNAFYMENLKAFWTRFKLLWTSKWKAASNQSGRANGTHCHSGIQNCIRYLLKISNIEFKKLS